MRPLQAHCYLGLGTLYTKVGQLAQRPRTLHRHELLHTMGMTFWLPEAEAMLAQTQKYYAA